MSNKSLENVNNQFITVLKSLNIEDSKQHKLSINLDLKKKIKTIISIQSLEERKSNIPKYLSNSKSYISLLSLVISLTTKTLFTIFINNDGANIIRKVMEEEEGDKVSICIEFIHRMILTYGMEFDTNFLIKKAAEYEKWEVFDILDNFGILFEGDCICKMLVYKIINSTTEGVEYITDKIIKSKYRKIYEYIKYNKVKDDNLKNDNLQDDIIKDNKVKNDNLKDNNLQDDIIKNNNLQDDNLQDDNLKDDIIKDDNLKNDNLKDDNLQCIEDKNLEKVLMDILFLRNLQNKKVEGVKINEEVKKEENIKKNIEIKPIVKEEKKIEIKEEIKPEIKKEVKKIVKKKMVFKKKEPSVNYLNIKWTKIDKKDTLFESIDLDYYKEKFSKEDLEYFIKVPEVKKLSKEIKREILMDPKKSYALNIALSRIKCDYKDVVYGILQQDSEVLNDNLINQLLLYFPTDQEVSNILSISSTDKYVLFFKECGDCIQDVRNNLKSIKLDFLIKNCNINYIKIFNNFFIEVYNSRYIKELIGCILYIGNIVNKGTTYGGAEGFSILDIPSILNMRLNNQEKDLQNKKIGDLQNKKIGDLHNKKIGDMINEKIGDMINKKKGNVQTVKDLIKGRIPNNDINISSYNSIDLSSDVSVRNISYDNLLNEIREIINLKKDILIPHKKYEDMYIMYKEMIELSEKIKKRFSLDRINDETIRLIIELCDIQDKHK